jgi:hypothetical protein
MFYYYIYYNKIYNYIKFFNYISIYINISNLSIFYILFITFILSRLASIIKISIQAY